MERCLFLIITYIVTIVGGSYTFGHLYRWICVRLKFWEAQNPGAVKMAGAVSGILCLHHYGVERWEQGLLVFLFFGILTAAAFIDRMTMEIPNLCVMLIALLAAVSCPVITAVPVGERLLGMVCVSLPMLFISVLTSGGFGGGDIKLLAASGFFLGARITLVSAVLALFLAGGYGAFMLAAKKMSRRSCLALGPFLCAGLVVGTLYGERMFRILI